MGELKSIGEGRGGAFDVEIVQTGAELRLAGRLDARSAAVARHCLQEAVDGGSGDLTLQLGAVEIWDGTGLGVLVGANRRARRSGRRMVLIDVQPRELRLLRAARISRLAVAC